MVSKKERTKERKKEREKGNQWRNTRNGVMCLRVLSHPLGILCWIYPEHIKVSKTNNGQIDSVPWKVFSSTFAHTVCLMDIHNVVGLFTNISCSDIYIPYLVYFPGT